jgi:hypothetical protein
MEKITLHRLLTELKTINLRITKRIDSLEPIAVKRGNKLMVSGRTSPASIDEFIKDAESEFQSVTDLIKRKYRLRSALLKANISTKVTICGVEYSITEAIEMKDNLSLKQQLLSRLREQLSSSNIEFNNATEQVDRDFERMLTTQTSGITNKSDLAKVREDFRTAFYGLNEVSVVDPLKLKDKIDELTSEINDFTTEVDAALSEINATTLVEVD